jgi:hypothetical protein
MRRAKEPQPHDQGDRLTSTGNYPREITTKARRDVRHWWLRIDFL